MILRSLGALPLALAFPVLGVASDDAPVTPQAWTALLELLSDVRTINGSSNNLQQPAWGSAGSMMRRMARTGYDDGIASPGGAQRPSARHVSNVVVAQDAFVPNSLGASDFVWQWGQFLDHDLDLTETANPSEPFDIHVPVGDPWFDPASTDAQVIPLSRSHWQLVGGIREQVNAITAWIDGSMVYGSDEVRSHALRTLDGTGRLATSAGDLLPFNEQGLPNAPSNAPVFFLAGDVRVNEQVCLTAIHTLFVREHNRLADAIRQRSEHEVALHGHNGGNGTPGGPVASGGSVVDASGLALDFLPGINAPLSDDQIYQLARALVIAEIQSITVNEFLPILLGADPIGIYAGYQPDVCPDIPNEFATAAYRFGHSMLSPVLRRLDASGATIPDGDISLAQAFFNPAAVLATGIEPLLRGLADQTAQEIDVHIVDDVRNFLFGAPGSGGFDLASLNLQRGRDHGLASYVDLCSDIGLGRATSFADISSDQDTVVRLAAAYPSVDQVDAWVGILAEDHVPGALVGPTLQRILSEQFAALRDGDRYWYELMDPRIVRHVERQTLARIIRRNTSIGHELQADVFRSE